MAEKPNLTGVSFENKPVTSYIAKNMAIDPKSREIEVIRKQGEKRKRFTVVYKDEKEVKPDTRKVAKRVTRLTDRQIRKEYGIMKKPFESKSENAIWAIIEKGPLTTKEVGQEIGFTGKDNSLSAMVATIWARLGDAHEGAARILKREQKGLKYIYSKADGVDVSVEAAIEKFKLVGSALYRKQYATKRLNSDTPKADTPKAEKADNEVFRRILETKGAALEIKVTGRVDVVFRFER
jgi:hypothetical protein